MLDPTNPPPRSISQHPTGLGDEATRSRPVWLVGGEILLWTLACWIVIILFVKAW